MKEVWLIGTSAICIEHAKVLNDISDINLTVIGRGSENAKKFYEQTQISPIIGGVTNFLKKNVSVPDYVIVAVGTNELKEVALELLNFGVKNILLEKPGAKSVEDLKEIQNSAKQNNANVLIAYNRRFYESVAKAKEIVKADGGILSCNFEFTEWSHIIEKLGHATDVMAKWFMGNSTHVVDLAFHLIGNPKEIASYTSGSLSWHPTGSIFSGAGISTNNILFSYHANWESAGRWSLEILTAKRKLIFRPMEQLAQTLKGTVAIEPVEIEFLYDTKFKPGFYLQTKSFLESQFDSFCTLEDQIEKIKYYNQIANY